jgi:aerobic C4-dicarboxylate transport protein
VVVSKWEKELDSQRMDDVLHGRMPAEDSPKSGLDLEPVRAAA